MVKISKTGETLLIETCCKNLFIPCNTIVTHSDDDAETVEIKLRASRKTIVSFRYDEMEPAQESAEKAAQFIANL